MRVARWLGKRWVRWTLGSLLAAAVALGVTLSVLARRVEPFLRARIVDAISTHFHARVELDEFHLALGSGLHGEWGVWAHGSGLRIWRPAGWTSAAQLGTAGANEPMIALEEFRFHAPLRYKPGVPVHIAQVRLQGLTIRVPPRSHLAHAPQSTGPAMPGSQAGLVAFRVDSVACVGARLVMETGNPAKLPLEFAISHLILSHILPEGAVNFDAELTNPRPRGTIQTQGSFGPWVVSDPGASALAGVYRFEHADLSTLRGIAGTLNSTGRYAGTLHDMDVEGETDTPDFRLTRFSNTVPLHTRFRAQVDGTNGDTKLEAVEARLGHSNLQVRGEVVRVLAQVDGRPRSIGHDIALAVQAEHGRVEDFLLLVSRSNTPMLLGDLALTATLHVPPGPLPVQERMRMDGRFALTGTRFTNASVQNRIRELSLRGQGRPDDLKSPNPEDVQSAMHGDFSLAGGVLALPNLEYTVPGADIRLRGSYTLEGGKLDFLGAARMQATVSQMVGGWKGMLLKPADRFFKRGSAGAEIPIRIGGTRDSPEFAVDLNRLKTTSPQSPQSGPQ